MLTQAAESRLIRLARNKLRTGVLHELSTDSGCFNYFIPITETIAVKVSKYDPETDMDGAGGSLSEKYYRQREAYEHGLGPYCFGIFRFEDSAGDYYQGYLTEIVPMAETVYPELVDVRRADMCGTKHRINVKHLVYRLFKNTNFSFYDYHSGNLGVKNGRLICIDFDAFEDRDFYTWIAP